MSKSLQQSPTIDDVKSFWSQHPLATFEASAPPGTREFFDWHNQVRYQDEGRFTEHLYEFDRHTGEKVLDIGCGIGWIVWNFAKQGSEVYAIDLTEAAIALTQQRLNYDNLTAVLQQANAESLPFDDCTFDFVISAGVLHHTPETEKAISEALRVLKPGCRAMIALYYKHFLLSPALWPITRFFIQKLFANIPGRSNFANVQNVDDLVRLYDGNQNPIGKAYSRKELRQLFYSHKILRVETHYFPTRFLLPNTRMTNLLGSFLDRIFGLMIYATIEKTN